MDTTMEQPYRAGRTINDFGTVETLRRALALCNVPSAGALSFGSSNNGTGNFTGDKPGYGDADWLLPVPDPEAEVQTVETEIQRLFALKSYLALDAEKEEAFDRLCKEACEEFDVPVSTISLVDLGRQFAFGEFGLPNEASRQSPRNMAFCAHTILSKKSMCVVNDTHLDDRFRENKFVTEAPYLRFYAGVPLVSPEGYKIGTFCVEGPTPKPQGLTQEQVEQLRGFADRAMELMVRRRERLLEEQRNTPMGGGDATAYAEMRQALLKHAGTTTNLGGLLYYQDECYTAMQLFQESVQTLMCLQDPAPQESSELRERMDEMSQLVNMLSAETNTPESRKAFVAITKKLFPAPDSELGSRDCRVCATDGIPGLFGRTHKLKGTERLHLAGLVFAEPFKIKVDPEDTSERHFIIPLEQCSKATLFNMGLVHYHWGCLSSAIQFFDLASSMTQQLSPLAFDPVILGSFNNMAQIHLQHGRTQDAMDLLQDALVRGNAALAALYGDDKAEWRPGVSNDAQRSRRLRRKLARTVMNMGHVHYLNCEYEAAMATCHDALRLLHPNMDDPEVAAVWYNMGILFSHQGKKSDAIAFLDRFVERAMEHLHEDHLQIAEAMHMKGVIMYEMGNPHECLKPLNEALRIRRKRLNDESSSVADSLCAIGRVYQAREEYDVALNAFMEGMSIRRKLAGTEGLTFEAAEVMLDIGRTLHVQKRLDEALAVYQEVTELTKRMFGPDHAFVARLQHLVGNLHLEAGHVQQAVDNFSGAARTNVQQGLPVDFSVTTNPLGGAETDDHPMAPTA